MIVTTIGIAIAGTIGTDIGIVVDGVTVPTGTDVPAIMGRGFT